MSGMIYYNIMSIQQALLVPLFHIYFNSPYFYTVFVSISMCPICTYLNVSNLYLFQCAQFVPITICPICTYFNVPKLYLFQCTLFVPITIYPICTYFNVPNLYPIFRSISDRLLLIYMH